MKAIKKILTFTVFCCILLLMVDFVRFPYYNNNYIANNKNLFKEDM